MSRLLFPIALTLVLASCSTDTTGISKTTSRTPKGNPDAFILVQEWGDLQCPACKAAFDQITGPLLNDYGNSIRFEFHHFPLRSIHPFALDAAEAVECAADQGKFWEYHDLIYTEQEKLSSEALEQWATRLKLNTDLFERCTKSNIKRKLIIEEFQQGRELGVSGTPTFFVNGQKVDSSLEDLKAAIDAELGKADVSL